MICTNAMGKRLHCIVRPQLFSITEEGMSTTQMGGRPHSGMDTASQCLKQFFDLLFAFRMSRLAFYIDMRAAFYNVLRHLLYHKAGDEE